jgi:uncharacterized 2Fe-2S/4Fe-4S cluster protein (DUF4445 family)
LADCVLLLDIGTTTISAEIINTASNRSLIKGAIINSQSEIAEDIISRIDFALKSESNTALLKHKAIFSINKLVKKILRQCPISNADIKQVFCACNSAIHHILLGIDTRTLITPPYKIRQKEEITVCAGVMGLKIKKNIPLTFLPNIGGFVGSDAFCAALAGGIYKTLQGFAAVVDIGTNGEILLGNRHRILAASAAAGPAFGARHIKNGMQAVRGAITGVNIKNSGIELDVIGKINPKGITGSGLIDACYQLYKQGFIDRSGRMAKKEFVLYKNGRRRISITQSDVRRLQLAKGAILAGIKVLLKKLKADYSCIQRITITGAFGAGLNIESVIGLGIVPAIAVKKIQFMQDAVLKGLWLYARDKAKGNALRKVFDSIEHTPLLGRKFAEDFAGSLSF